MNYIILGKSQKKGTITDDSSSLQIYFELGWEVVGSRIDIINLINSNKIDIENTTLVTTNDRKFMYTKFFPNVISTEDYNKLDKNNSKIYDWTESLNFRFLNAYDNFVDPITKKYVNLERDYETLFNGFDLSESIYNDLDENYVVIAMRYREHNGHKNANEIFFKKLVHELKNVVTKKIFVVGYGSERFCEENNCIYVDRLVDYVSLIKNKKCLSLIAQSTGTLCLALMCSNVHIQLLDHAKASEIHGDNAVLGGVCVQLCKSGITPYYTLSDEIINSITKKSLQS